MTHSLLMTNTLTGTDGAIAAASFGIGLLFVLVIVTCAIALYWRIASKAGYPGAMSLLMLVPVANLIVLIVFAFSEWPIQRALRLAQGGGVALPPGGGSYVPPGGGGYAPTAQPIDIYAQPYRPDPPPPAYGVPPPPPAPPKEPF